MDKHGGKILEVDSIPPGESTSVLESSYEAGKVTSKGKEVLQETLAS